MHVASVGELEAGRGVRTALDRRVDEIRWTVSFSSPSGIRDLEAREHDFSAVGMLPLDSRQRICRFLETVSPDLILFVRYDLWPNLVAEAAARGIRTALVSASVSPDSGRLSRIVRRLFSATLSQVDLVSAVTEEDGHRLSQITGESVPVDGDPRIDRVFARLSAHPNDQVAAIERRRTGRPLLVLGSVWLADVEGLDLLSSESADWDVMIVPHVVDPESIDAFRRVFPGIAVESESIRTTGSESLRLLVDRVGLLVELYRNADVAYVGGGFGAGVHSLIEPAVQGAAVVCGPNFSRSPDAVRLHAADGVEILERPSDLARFLGSDDSTIERRKRKRDRARSVIEESRGASDRIAEKLESLLNGTKIRSKTIEE